MPLPVDSYLQGARDNAWIREFLTQWELDLATGGGDAELELRLRNWIRISPDAALSLIMSLVERCSAGDAKIEGAVGDYLYWFLNDHGNAYIYIIGQLAQREARLRRVLGRVYAEGLSRGVRHKIDAWRNEQ